MAVMRKGVCVIFGVQPVKPLANLPPDALRVRFRLRNDRIATAFVKFADRIEKWVVGPAGGKLAGHTEWELLAIQGVNHVTK